MKARPETIHRWKERQAGLGWGRGGTEPRARCSIHRGTKGRTVVIDIDQFEDAVPEDAPLLVDQRVELVHVDRTALVLVVLAELGPQLPEMLLVHCVRRDRGGVRGERRQSREDTGTGEWEGTGQE